MNQKKQIILWTVVGLFAVLPILFTQDYPGNGIIHFILEITGGFLALCTALFAVNCSFERREGITSYITLGFLTAGLTDILHALFSLGIPMLPEASIESFLSCSWTLGRTLLGIILLWGLVRTSGERGFRPSTLWLSVFTMIIMPLTIILLTLFPLPSFVLRKSSLIHRPWEFLALLLYIACFFVILKGSERRNSRQLIPFLVLGVITQLLMSMSQEAFRNFFNGSHVLKDISYLAAAVSYGTLSWKRSRYSIEVSSIRQLVAGSIMFLFLSCSLVIALGFKWETSLRLSVKADEYRHVTSLIEKINTLSDSSHAYLLTGDKNDLDNFSGLWVETEHLLYSHVIMSVNKKHPAGLSGDIRALKTYVLEALSLPSPVTALPESLRIDKMIKTHTDVLLNRLKTIVKSQSLVIRAMEEKDMKQTSLMLMGQLFVLIGFLPVLFIIAVAMTSRHLKHILSLTEMASRIKDGERYERAHVTAEDETGTLAAVFNDMLDSIEISQKKLQEAHDELELQVAERTDELNSSRQMLQEVLDTIPVRVFWKDLNSVYLGCNRLFALDAGLNNSEEIIGKADDQLQWADHSEIYIADDREVMDSGKPKLSIEELRTMQSGKKTWLLTSKVPLLDQNNRIIGILGTYDNITERKKSEEEIRKLVEIIRRSDDFIGMAQPEGQVIFLNDAGQRLVGLDSTGKILPRTIFEYFFDADLRFVREEILQKMFEKGLWKGESRFRHFKSGKSIPIEMSAFTIVSPQTGEVLAIAMVCRNISEIKKYQENLGRMVEERTEELRYALRDAELSRDRIDGILKSVADGLIVTDRFNKVILMNRSAEDLLGVRSSELINKPIDFAIHDITLREKVVETLSKKGTGNQFDFTLPGSSPEYPRCMRGRTSVIYDREGIQTGTVTIMYDVTHEKEIDRMKTEFISTAAHELRTPLTSIRGFSEILLTKELMPGEHRKFLTYINEQSMKLGNIINELLNISRIESGVGFTLNKVFFHMDEAIRKIVMYFEGITSKHIFDIELLDEPAKLYADRDKMEQVLKNVLGNAVKYSHGGGHIKISDEIRNGQYLVMVKDEGIGMTPEQVNKIFDKFYRADISDSAIEGTGLGMTIVKYIIEAHGGDILVESKYGSGTTVRFKLPLLVPHANKVKAERTLI